MNKLIIRDGTSQAKRALPALQDGYFNLDEMSFQELLAMVSEFGKLVHFVKADNSVDEDTWALFFRADETIVMSRILSFDSSVALDKFDQWWRDTPEHAGRDVFSGGAAGWDPLRLPVAGLAIIINGWYVDLAQAQSDKGQALRVLIDNVIAQLCADKSGLLTSLLSAKPHLHLDPVWQDGIAAASALAASVPATDAPAADTRLTKSVVRSDFHAFLKAIEMIRKEALARLPASLQSQQHDPAVALLIAFVRQFQKLQGKLNRFTRNYLDFYYDQMLGCRPWPAVLDHTWLVLSKNSAARDVLVPAQTAFLAGLDEQGRDVLYQAQHALEVNDARVTSLYTLYFDHNRYSSPENLLRDYDGGDDSDTGKIVDAGTHGTTGSSGNDDGGDDDDVGDVDKSLDDKLRAAYKWPTAAWFSAVPVTAAGKQDLQPFPILGAPKSSIVTSTGNDARIGFALASKVLLLKEGARRIKISIEFDNDLLAQRLERLAKVTGGQQDNVGSETGSAADWEHERVSENIDDSNDSDDSSATTDTGNDADDSDDALRKLEEIRRKDIFIKVFRGIFSIDVTGEFGWLPVAAYEPFYDGHTLVLEFELPPQLPSVVAYQPALHGGSFDGNTAVVRCLINPGAYLYPYGMLRDLPIRGAHIAVQVRGARDLVLHNNIGQLSATAPFAPFGPLPKLGSYLVVGSTEMAGKQISDFSVEVEWADLTRLNGGFATYYDGYGVSLSNDDFLVSVGVLAKGNWTPANEQKRPTVPLFSARVQPGQGERLDSRVVWHCEPVAHLFEPDAGVSVSKPLTYGPGAKNGFFKFTLAAPSFAFGHEPYPQLLSAALVYNSRMKLLRRARTVPRAPYTPQINAIAINYRAADAIPIDRKTIDSPADSARFIHLYPNGWEALGVASYPGPSLLPRFDFAGNLYVGIEAAELGAVLTLFFQLREDSLPLPAETVAAGGLHWFYLSGNEWKLLPKSSRLSDSTQNFMTSGIVTLALPADITADNSVMPSGSYWLRVSAISDLEKYCSLYAVHAQALEVQRAADTSAQVSMLLPPATITRSKKPLPGVTAIVQPLASTGGRPAETRAQLRTRISERLRHKDRAVSAVDYEALILQYFPEVYKVKCFANLVTGRGPHDCIQAGHALIVPLPYWPQEQNQMPMLNGNLMQEIRSFLQERASPWSHISVENPVYERIQVRCKVKFAGTLGNGYYLSLLNRAISDFLTPWYESFGYRTHFGWRVRQHDLEAFIDTLPYIESVSAFSMLRIASEDALTFSLFDTAAQSTVSAPGAAPSDSADITPLCPWSIAVPAARHAIDVIDDALPHPPQRTALNSLAIGSTFIISENDHG